MAPSLPSSDSESQLDQNGDIAINGTCKVYKNVDALKNHGIKLEIKRLQQRWKDDVGTFVNIEDIVEDAPEENASDAEYAFSVIRRFKPTNNPNMHCISTIISVRSPWFSKVAETVMHSQKDITWESRPLEFEPVSLLTFLPQFQSHLDTLKKDPTANSDEDLTISHLSYLINFLSTEYASTLAQLASLHVNKQITFNLLWSILVPGTILLTTDSITGDLRAVRLVSSEIAEATTSKPRRYVLQTEYVDFKNGGPGLGVRETEILQFHGASQVTDLEAFPMDYYMEEDRRMEVRRMLVERGRRYLELSREKSAHKKYSAIAYRKNNDDYRKISIKCRIVLDRALFDELAPSYYSPHITRDLDGQLLTRSYLQGKKHTRRVILTEDELMMMPVRMFGFSLGDRKWLEFNVKDVEDIVWNHNAFAQLSIPPAKKELVKALIESHIQQSGAGEGEGFDDFIEGKGVGLVFNLHGPPGVGKTLTAEATSEVAHAPLYSVSSGDLGTTAEELDGALSKVFQLATAWRAVVLIDEADVFLERRDIGDLVRNAMVAVFLRQLEYYPGILILTTNRVSIMDEAIKSRIHISLQYDPLTASTRAQLWRAFLLKAGLPDAEVDALSGASPKLNGFDHLNERREVWTKLCARSLNGREIKNVVRAAAVVAGWEGRKIEIGDVLRVADVDKQN